MLKKIWCWRPKTLMRYCRIDVSRGSDENHGFRQQRKALPAGEIFDFPKFPPISVKISTQDEFNETLTESFKILQTSDQTPEDSMKL